MRREDLFKIPKYSLKLVIYTAQALLGAWEQFTYELDQELDPNPKIPIRNQADAIRVAEALRESSMQGVAEALAATAGDADEFDDHAPTIGSGSILDAYTKRASRDPVRENN